MTTQQLLDQPYFGRRGEILSLVVQQVSGRLLRGVAVQAALGRDWAARMPNLQLTPAFVGEV
jgi:hypothetical protein